jgi:hypothetical protein
VDEGAQSLLEQVRSYLPLFVVDACAHIYTFVKVLDINPSKRPSIDKLKAHHFFSSIDWKSVASRAQPAPLTPRVPAHPPSPKTLRINFGTPYNAESATTDLMPHFAFTSSRFRKSRSELTCVVPSVAKRTPFARLYGWMTTCAVKVGMWWTSAASLLCLCR